jgi:hypothetical protein
MSASGPTVPPPGPSRLFALPRELRDIVYDYVLAEDDGLLLVEHHDPNTSTRSFKGCRNSDPSWEANQLKYVCCQLFEETKGLGLGLNELKTKSIADFANFIATCSTDQQKRIRKLTLSTDANNPAMAFEELSGSIIPSHCISHPQCDVRLRLGYYHEELGGHLWVWGAALLLCVINRHAHPFVPGAIRQSMKSASMPKITTFCFPKNIRVFPSAPPPEISSEAFLQAVKQFWDENHVGYVREELRKWYRDGF